MIYVNVRFYNQHRNYYSAVLRFKTDNLELVAGLIGAMRCGLLVSGRGDLLWDTIAPGVSSSTDVFELPGDVEWLKLFLKEHYA